MVLSILLILNLAEGVSAADLKSSSDNEEISTPMRVVGILPLFELDPPHGFVFQPLSGTPKGGWLVVNRRSRRGYQIFQGTGVASIWSFDLDTLRPIRRGTVPMTLRTGGKEGDLVHAVDEVGARLFFASIGSPPLPPFGSRINQAHVIVLDEKDFEQGETNFVSYWPLGLSEILSGITFTRNGGLEELFIGLEYQPTLGLAQNITRLNLVKLDAQTGLEIGQRVELNSVCGRLSLPTSAPGIQYQMELLRRPQAVYLGCEGPNFGAARVVKVPVTASGELSSAIAPQTFTLPRRLGAVLADRGRGRIILEAAIGGSSLWVFDATRDAWVGSIGLNAISLGIDEETGRLYALSAHTVRFSGNVPLAIQGGLQFTDLGLTPVFQLTNALPKLAYPGHLRIVVDPESPEHPRHVFVRRGHWSVQDMWQYPSTSVRTPTPLEDFYTVVEDKMPITSTPPLAQVDRNTVDAHEETGITGANFEAFGSGFGVRGLWLSGVTGITSNTYRDNITGGLAGNCSTSDREFVSGWAQSGKLSNLGASASALSFDADLATRDDLKRPATRCWPLSILPSNVTSIIDSQAGEQWRGFTAECVGTKEESQTQGAPGKFTQGAGRFTASTECKHEEQRVETYASGFLGPGGDSAPIRVASGSSRVEVKRDPEGGAIVEVTSAARGIEISGGGFIAMVETKATSQAAGRPGTAKTTFVRTICPTSTSCTTDEAQQNQMIDSLNQLLRPLGGAAFLRSPDPELAAGSPGGYLATIQRHRNEGPFDRDINRDYLVAVAGLEIIFNRGDSASEGSGRHIYQFAAVQAETSYGIYCLLGQAPGDKCNAPVGDDDFVDDLFDDSVDPESSITLGVTGSGGLGRSAGAPSGGPGEIVRIIEKIAEGLGLLFSSPKEAALMAAVWLLFWIPSYLGERRRMLLGV